MPSRRSVSLAALLFAGLAATTLFIAVPLRGQQRQVLPTRLSAPAGIKAVGRLPGSQRLSLAITLRLRNQEELQGLLHDLYDPASPNYRHFLSVEEFTERFGPTTDDYERVADFARSNGLVVMQTAANRLVLDVSGTVSDIERAFHVTMQVYQHPTEPRTFYAPNVEPSVDASLPVQGISGLNNFSPPHPASLHRAPAGKGALANASGSGATGSGPNGVFLGSDIRAAYAPGVTLDGSGQAVGLFEEGGYNLSDVQLYFSNVNQPLNVPIVNVLLDGVSGACGNGCDDGEEALDIEQAISMAPNLSALIVYEGNSHVDILNQMATDNIAKQLSCSYVWYDDALSVDPIFQEFAAQGQNLFASSGDGGAFTPPSCTSNCWSARYPSADPYVTAVGGTDLTTSGPGGAWQSETAWVLSGGGITSYPIQSYQAPLINSLNQGSTTLRNVPDVAAVAENVYSCSNGVCGGGTGTSVSAPIWGGFLALANQQAGGVPIGFLNPTIYAIAQNSSYGNDFHDITVGNNFNSFSPDLFSAVAGYDLVTGLGSPNGQSLLTALGPAPTGPNFALVSSPGTLSVTQGSQATSTITVQAVNGFSGTVNLRATVLGQPAGVTASLSQPSITESAASTLTVSTTDATSDPNLVIVVTGTSGGLAQTAYIKLAVLLPDLVETAVSGPPMSVKAGDSFSVTDTVQNIGQAPAGSSITQYYLSSTTTKTSSSKLLTGSRSVPPLPVNATSSGTVNVMVPLGLWPNTLYHLLACANDTNTVAEASSGNCIASTATTFSSQPTQLPTSITLAVTSAGGAVTSVTSGSVVTLTATVVSGSTVVPTGQVNFCDASAKYCTDIHLLGTAQLTSAGTAALSFVPGIGSHSYKAVFVGATSETADHTSSTSNEATLTVTGTFPTATAIAQSGVPGNYTLTATVAGPGQASPTGTVSFLDTSSGNTVLGMAALVAVTPGLNWIDSQTPATGYKPTSVAVGDFNGDGIPDLAVTNEGDASTNWAGTVTILLGNGDGTFRQTAASPATGDTPTDIVASDFNGDGKVDLAVATAGSCDQTTILLGNGDGTFRVITQSIPGQGGPGAIAVGDFNGDGIPDLAVAGISKVSILLGNGDGTFTPGAIMATGITPNSIAVADFNGDGRADLAVVNIGSNTVTIFLGNGDGTFSEGVNLATGNFPVSVAVADFNGDGIPDLAVTNADDSNLTILLGKGDGTFTAAASPATDSYPVSVAVGDFNGDGIPDLAVATRNDTVTILLGKGDGTFTASAVSPATGNFSEFVGVGNFSGHGGADLAVVNNSDSTVTVLLSELSQATATVTGISPVGSGEHLVEASYPGDGNYNPSVSSTTGLTASTVHFSPTSLTFGSQNVGTTSGSQPVTLSNEGTAALTITSITASANFGTTNNCAGSVAASGSCTINVTFSPTATGTLTGTLTTTDNSNGVAGSAQSVALSGTGQDFTLAAPSGSSASVTVAPGSPASYTLSTAGEGGFNQSVSFTCTGAPSEATCSVSPNPVTPGSSATNVTVTVTTTAPSVSAPRSRPLPPVRPPLPGPRSLVVLALALAAMSWALARRKQPGVSRWRSTIVLLASGLLLTMALAGCGGGGGSTNVTHNPGTPAGTYTLTLTGSTGSGTSALSHKVTLTLVVS